MSRRYRVLPALLLMTSLAGSAAAAPMRVTVVGDTNSSHSELLSPERSIVNDGIISQTILPDDFLTNGFDVSWQKTSFTGYSGQGQTAGHALLTFIFDRATDGPPVAGSPSVSMKALFDGEISRDDSGRPYGQLTQAKLETSLANWTPSSDIPRSVIDVFLDSQRTSIFPYAAGGRPGYVQVDLSVRLVPEVASWAAWALLGLGAMGLRRCPRGVGKSA